MFWIFWKHFIATNDAATSIDLSVKDKSQPSHSAKTTRPLPVNSDDLFTAFSAYGSDVFCVVDDSINAFYLSDNWQTVSGLSVEKCLGTGIKERIQPLHLSRIMEYLSASDNEAIPVRFQLKTSNNDWNWFEMQLAAISRRNGKKQYTCLLRDVDELVSAQNKYEKYKVEADLAIKSRSEFLANMNHELRTPLNAIIGFSQMMENGVYGEVGHPKYNDYISNIQASGMTLLSKVNDLIDIANIDSGRMSLNEAPIDLIALIRDAVELQSHRALEERITIRENLPVKEVMVIVDRVRMLQVLGNIISNSIKYNSAGGVVDIYCEKRKDGGVNIIVEDDGKGISATHLERIITAFNHENSFFARSRHCAGIGLALSKEIVKLHQGRIEIKSETGKGTSLKIILPAERSVKATARKTTNQDCMIG